MGRVSGIPGILIKAILTIGVCAGAGQSLAAGDSVSRFGISLQFVEGGEFERGGPVGCLETDSEDCKPRTIYDEEPRHTVALSDFYLCRTEITRQQWARVMGEEAPSAGDEHLPKVNVSWEDALAFLAKLSELDGRTFRLPTEAEWEYAATSKVPSPLKEYAWFRDNSSKQSQRVAQLKPNAFGLYDMLGNVWEWTSDWYGEEYYRSVSGKDPQGPSEGARRVVRGGAFNSVVSYVRHGVRMGFAPDTKSAFTGFRCAVSASAKK